MKHTIDTDELKPCPFCGSHNISAGEVSGNHLDGTYFVQTACMNCGALSPEAKTENESVELWNRRKANSPQADGMVLVPIEPTEEMLDNADDVFHRVWKEQREYAQKRFGKDAFCSLPFSQGIYKAMLSAYKPQAELPLKIIVDPTLRDDEIVFKQDKKEVGRIIVSQADDVRKDAEPTDAELGRAMRGNYDAAKKFGIEYIRWNVSDIDQAIDKARE